MYDKDIFALQSYIEEFLFEPKSGWPKECFEDRSYSRWAAQEILERIIQEALQPPPHITSRFPRTTIEIVVNFIDDLSYLSNVREGSHHKRIFLYARYAAENIGDMFRAIH